MKKILIFIFILALHTQYALTDNIKDPRIIGNSKEQQLLKEKKFQICLYFNKDNYKYDPYLTRNKECDSDKDLLINSQKDFNRYWVSYFETADQRKCIYGNCYDGEGILVVGDYHYKGKFIDGYFVGKEIYNFLDGKYFYFNKYYHEVNKKDWRVYPANDDENLFPAFEISGTYYEYATRRDQVYDYDNLLTKAINRKYSGGFFKDKFHGWGEFEDRYYNDTIVGQFVHGKNEGYIKQTFSGGDTMYEGIYSHKNKTLKNATISGSNHTYDNIKIIGDFIIDLESDNWLRGDGELEIRITEEIENNKIVTKFFGEFSKINDTAISLNDVENFKPYKKQVSGYPEPRKNYTYEGDLEPYSSSKFDYMSHGQGIVKFESGGFYEGEFKRNLPHGFGTFKKSNGDIYTGEFVNNLYHGQGKIVYANGEVYDGKWEYGKKLLKSKTDKKYYALVIGNNNYQNLEKLDAAANDAKVISKILEDKYDFEVNLLIDADYETTVNTFYKLSRKLKKNDNFLIFYAGHGHLDKKQNRGYWLPTDANPDLPSKWISNALIADELKATEAKHVLLIVDSCFSGSLMRSSDNLVKEQSLDDKYIKLLENKKTRLVISSGGNEPVLDSDGGDHSVFARKLIDTLKENKNVISTQQIFENIRKYVFSNAKQTPERAAIYKAGHDGGDFLFFAN